MASTQPNARTWILRFKNNRTTILLHIDPLQSLTSVKQELLTALQQTHRENTLNGIIIPQNPTDILLARPRDINNLTLGFESIEPKRSPSAFENDISASAGKGKGKAAVTNSKTASAKRGEAQLQDCAQGAGLRDHGIVAFKFRKGEQDEARESIERDGDEGIVVAREDMEGVEEAWDVVVPSYEETYGEEP